MTKQQRLVLTISILASFVAFLDGMIVNVALPAIQQELGGGLSAQQWIVDAYLLTLGSLILIAGSLSDLLGRKKILTLGLVGFGITSLLCAVAPNAGSLIIFRALQGIAGALLVPSSLALIIATFSGAAQGKAIGSWTAWTGIAAIIGPLLGGILVDAASWRWIFAVNVLPIAITLFLLRGITVAEDKPKGVKVDFTGALLCATALGAAVYALIEQPHYGWVNPHIYLSLIGGVVLFVGFLRYERRTRYPMLPFSLFKNRNFSVGNLATLLVYAGLSAGVFVLTVFLQGTVGYSALWAGLSLLPITLMMFTLSSRFGALAGKYGPRLFMGVGPIIAGIGFLMMRNLGTSFDYWTALLPAVVIFGLGLSITVAPLTAAVLGDVHPRQAGIASAVNNAVARMAGLIAIAAVGAIVSAQFAAALTDGYNIYSPQQVKVLQQTPFAPPHPLPPQGGYQDEVVKQATIRGFAAGILTVSGLLITGGIISLAGIRNSTKAQ